ncbi:hypothetical protein [Phenylobacterium sp. J367]|uniref:hypothetical protein n=1 Tax=Phenylobacterium sp. J367 TaxID=2898435 RepID=UPI0021518092|nr:hypothetical protein [Phenylobacterium sp. J367]MCR5878463.1 hypothetical protein [Phenylobacterium sp. J367]
MTRAAPMIAALAAAGVALTAWPAAAEINPGQQEGLGLTSRDVPAILQKAKTDPYAPATCEAAYQEVAALDQILGPDADEPEMQKNAAGNLLIKGARSLIPYREVFRVVTGVDRKERALADAAMAGWARRGYLKGYLRGDDCSGEPTTIAASVDASSAATVEISPEPVASAPVAQVDLPPPAAPTGAYQTAEVRASMETALEAEN